jgi:hypothetical protein
MIHTCIVLCAQTTLLFHVKGFAQQIDSLLRLPICPLGLETGASRQAECLFPRKTRRPLFEGTQPSEPLLRRNTTFGVSCIGIYKKVMSEKYSYAASAKVGLEIKYVTRFFFVSSILRRFQTSKGACG